MNLKKYVILVLGISLMLFSIHDLFSQSLNVFISQSEFEANSCTRKITANVSNGSGNYSYQWSIATPGVPFPGSNRTRTIHVSLNTTTDFLVFVRDISSGATGSSSITVPRTLQGGFDTFIPNAFTPNGDGFNDTWFVADADRGFGSLNAYRYELNISNTSSISLFSRSETVTSGTIGLTGGDIEWNGRVNGTGAIVSNGTYRYSLRLYNCSGNQLIQGFIQVLGGSGFALSPNPVTNYITITLDSNTGEKLVVNDPMPYQISLFNDQQKLVRTSKGLDYNSITIYVGDIPRGQYVLHVMKGQEVLQKRLLLQ